MRIKVREKYICVEETLIIITFLCIFSNKARNFLSNYFICYLFIMFHETAHILIATIFGYEVKRINIRLAGLNAGFKEKIEGIKGIIIYLVGPISNIVLALIFKNVRIVFEINISLALINLVPIFPLDGYNIWKLILRVLTDDKTAKGYMNYIQKAIEIMMLILSIFMCIKNNNFSLFLLLVYIKVNSPQPLKSL
ncbi:MAG: M50 family metallopeptidase [Clostridia bacterium]|nr:M50 family metallopeptidase [Clostridia bacterium]